MQKWGPRLDRFLQIVDDLEFKVEDLPNEWSHFKSLLIQRRVQNMLDIAKN